MEDSRISHHQRRIVDALVIENKSHYQSLSSLFIDESSEEPVIA
jgi:hypothetical protein